MACVSHFDTEDRAFGRFAALALSGPSGARGARTGKIDHLRKQRRRLVVAEASGVDARVDPNAQVSIQLPLQLVRPFSGE